MSILPNTLIDDLKGLRKALPNPATIVDVGPGIRPANWFGFKPLCIEPSPVYSEILRDAGFEVLKGTARQMLPRCMKVDLILMLDVIEHMERTEGENVLLMAMKKGRNVVVYTPFDFVEQTRDEWGYGEHEWQTHRSGWLPGDFPGWDIIRGQEGFAALY